MKMDRLNQKLKLSKGIDKARKLILT